MLCHSCRRSLFTRARAFQHRGIATVPSTSNAAPSQPPPSTERSSTPAISSASPMKSQPFSTPFFPSTTTATAGAASSPPQKELKRTKLQGSVVGGAELKGVAYLKSHPTVLAKEDDEYPAWLWTLLDEGKATSGAAAADLAAMTKKQRAKYDRKQERLTKNLAKPIPVHEQAMDLTRPEDGANVSLQRRQEITKSSREARRKDIRETNFLRAM